MAIRTQIKLLEKGAATFSVRIGQHTSGRQLLDSKRNKLLGYKRKILSALPQAAVSGEYSIKHADKMIR